MLKIAEVCAAFEVDGLRADIVTARTAVAHAAWAGRRFVTRGDIRAAALLALPHRRRRNPFDAPGLDEDLLDKILGDDELPEPPEPTDPPDPDVPSPTDDEPTQPATVPTRRRRTAPTPSPRRRGAAPEADDAPHEPTSAGGRVRPRGADPAAVRPRAAADSAGGDSTVKAETAYRPRLFTVDGVGEGTPGRRSRALGTSRPSDRCGPRHGSAAGSLHLVETLRAAAERHAGAAHRTGRTGGRFSLHAADLRTAVREGREANLLLFCVDASGSMAARRRMTQVKTAILSLLTDAYRRRDKVGDDQLPRRRRRAEPPAHRLGRGGRRPARRPARRWPHPARRGTAHRRHRRTP